jgi:hypothetical protein
MLSEKISAARNCANTAGGMINKPVKNNAILPAVLFAKGRNKGALRAV